MFEESDWYSKFDTIMKKKITSVAHFTKTIYIILKKRTLFKYAELIQNISLATY